MATPQNSLLVPLAAPLPDPPKDEPLTDDQWLILMSLMDTVIPSICRASSATDDSNQLALPDAQYNENLARIKTTLVTDFDSQSLDAFLGERVSSNPDFQGLLKRSLMRRCPKRLSILALK